MTLEKFVIQFCHRHNITKSKLAAHANISRSTLYAMFEDDKQITIKNITKLAIAMGVHPQYLIQLEWQRYCFEGQLATPVNPLAEPKRWFDVLCNKHDNSHFISETVPDGSIVHTHERFIKTWRVQNTGSSTWEGRKLVCQDRHVTMSHSLFKDLSQDSLYLRPQQTHIDIPTTAAGEVVDLSVEFVAPSKPCLAFSYWKCVDADGELCFAKATGLYLLVNVVASDSANKSLSTYSTME